MPVFLLIAVIPQHGTSGAGAALARVPSTGWKGTGAALMRAPSTGWKGTGAALARAPSTGWNPEGPMLTMEPAALLPSKETCWRLKLAKTPWLGLRAFNTEGLFTVN
jgi:hypothetical protein